MRIELQFFLFFTYIEQHESNFYKKKITVYVLITRSTLLSEAGRTAMCTHGLTTLWVFCHLPFIV